MQNDSTNRPSLPQSLLVTGGAGFIGCNFVDRALTRGANVTILDDLSRAGSGKNLDWLKERHGDKVKLVQGSVTDAALCERLIAEVEAVAHFAAQVAVTTSVTAPRCGAARPRGRAAVAPAACKGRWRAARGRGADAAPPSIWASVWDIDRLCRPARLGCERGRWIS